MDDVLTELRLASESLDRMYGAQLRRNDQLEREIRKLWDDVAALRDDTAENIAALAKRIGPNAS